MTEECNKSNCIMPEVNKVLPDEKKNEEKNIENDITALEPKQQRFIHTYLTGQYKLIEIAELLGVHPNTLNSWMKRPEIVNIIKDYQQVEHEIVKTSLKALQLKAVNKMSELIDSPIDGIAFQASKDVLDRGGHKPQQQIKVDKTIITYEKKLKDLMSEALNDDDIIDIEFENIEE